MLAHYLRILCWVSAEFHVGSAGPVVETCLCHLHGVFLGTDGSLQVVDVPLLSGNLCTHLKTTHTPLIHKKGKAFQ